jgi:hypothetical protein
MLLFCAAKMHTVRPVENGCLYELNEMWNELKLSGKKSLFPLYTLSPTGLSRGLLRIADSSE